MNAIYIRKGLLTVEISRWSARTADRACTTTPHGRCNELCQAGCRQSCLDCWLRAPGRVGGPRLPTWAPSGRGCEDAAPAGAGSHRNKPAALMAPRLYRDPGYQAGGRVSVQQGCATSAQRHWSRRGGLPDGRRPARARPVLSQRGSNGWPSRGCSFTDALPAGSPDDCEASPATRAQRARWCRSMRDPLSPTAWPWRRGWAGFCAKLGAALAAGLG